MGLLDKLMGELVDIIEWLDDSSTTMVYRFERYNNEIKYGARLIVREGQSAIFVNEGQLADVFGPGAYELETGNLPILSTLRGWKHGFNSPFKAEVYFVSTRRFTDQKWGTKGPIMLRDPEFGPLRLRAFGTYALRVTDPATFLREVVSTDGRLSTEEISGFLRDLIASNFADALGESKIAALDLAANYSEFGHLMVKTLKEKFLRDYGLDLLDVVVGNITLPETVQEALDKRSSMGITGDLNRYMQYQTANAIGQAAANPGGPASDAMGLGAGMALANQMGQAMHQAMHPQQQSVPPPLPQQVAFHVAINGQQQGPFPLEVLQQKIAAGQLTATTLVWRTGLSGWIPAGQAPELAPLFAAVPPPLPS